MLPLEHATHFHDVENEKDGEGGELLERLEWDPANDWDLDGAERADDEEERVPANKIYN